MMIFEYYVVCKLFLLRIYTYALLGGTDISYFFEVAKKVYKIFMRSCEK